MRIAAACVLLVLTHCAPDRNAAPITGETMGTTWSLLIADDLPASARARLRTAIQKRLDEIEAVFSNWRPDSEVSRFNASPGTGTTRCSKELALVLHRALEIAAATDGALDPAIHPLITLWGFGPGPRRADLPSDDEIRATMERCGWRRVEVTLDPPTVRKLAPAVEINLSAIVEGFALRETGALLERAGWRHWLLEIGGELLARGAPRDGGIWRAGVQMPRAAQGETFSDLPLRDECLSTSGVYRQFRTAPGGARLPHLIDPRTGHPVKNNLASVSVLHADPLTADAFATALLVTGRERGEAIARTHDLRVLWIEARE